MNTSTQVPPTHAGGAPTSAPTGAPTRPAWFGELAVIAVLLFVYDRVADLAAVRAGLAGTHGERILALEGLLHLNVEHGAQRLLSAGSPLIAPASYWYDFAHVGVTISVLVAVWALRPGLYRRLRNVLVLVNLLALGVFMLYPVAPPRLLPGGGFRDVVALSHTPGSWDGSSTLSKHANEYASAPSLHAAYALWVVLAVVMCTRRSWLRALAATHLVLTLSVVLATGNHYLLDLVAGGLTVAVAARLTCVARGPAAELIPRQRRRLAAALPGSRVPEGR